MTFNKIYLVFAFLFLIIHSAYSVKNYSGGQENPDSSISNKDKALKEKIQLWLKTQPVEFVENKGQITDSERNKVPFVLFKAEASLLDLYVTKSGISYVFKEFKGEDEKEEREEMKLDRKKKKFHEDIKVHYERIDMELKGAQIREENIIKEDSGLTYFNYLFEQPDLSIYHIKKYRRLIIKNVYPGIDWVLYNSTESGFKYDFVVHPGAKPEQIGMVYRSKKRLKLDALGNIDIKVRNSHLQENCPYSYISETHQKVESRFLLISSTKRHGLFESHIGFSIQPRINSDEKQTLIIDPQLVWGTFYGGSGTIDGTFALDVDNAGNILACGYTSSTDFPVLSSGGFFQTISSTCFIVKFSNTGTLLWSTYYGSNGGLNTNFIATDLNNNIFVTGETFNGILPLQNAGTYFKGVLTGTVDAFISKFNSSGTLLWSTLYGGNGYDYGASVATDQNGNVFLTGVTHSSDFPILDAGTYFEGVNNGSPDWWGPGSAGYIAKFDNFGSLLWSTYLKGIWAPIVTTDPTGMVCLTGDADTLIPLLNPGGTGYFQSSLSSSLDLAILKFTNTGNLLWGTYYGGSHYDRNGGCVTDKFGNLFITGTTRSPDLPLQNAGSFFQSAISSTIAPDLFITKFNPAGTLTWATYLGGTREESLPNFDNLSIDTCGNLFVACSTVSRNIPLVSPCDGGHFDNVFDTLVHQDAMNVYIARFSNNGSLLWSSYLGGEAASYRNSLASDKFGNTFVSGEWAGAISNSYSYPIVAQSPTSYTSTYIGGDDIYFVKFTSGLPVPANFSYGIYCRSDTAHLPSLGAGFPSGGVFSSSANLSINPQTGQVTPSGTWPPGVYTVSYTNPWCSCSGNPVQVLGTATVSIRNSPLITISGNNTVCIGENVSYTATGAPTYTWNTGVTTPIINFMPTTTATVVYTVSSGLSNGCVAKKTITVTVNACTGLKEDYLNQRIDIYPNPNSGSFMISSDIDLDLLLVNEIGQQISEISLSDVNGRKVKIRNLSKGIYFLKNKKNQILNQKIVVVE